MRSYPIFFAAALAPAALAAALLAAPLPSAPAPAPPRRPLRADAGRFAQQLLGVIDQVAEHYVRPVSREELLHPALVALYQAARRPVPRDLGDRIRLAGVKFAALQAPPAGALAPSSASPADPLRELAREVRLEVGDAEALRHQNPLLLCCHALARGLDPHSGVVTAEEQQRAIGLDRECDGVGLELSGPGASTLLVEAVLMGGPGQRGGLRPGDRLVLVNGKPADRADPAALLELRNRRPPVTLPPVVPAEGEPREAPPAAVRVAFRRPGEAKERSAVLRRERFHPETVLGVRRRDDNGWDYFVRPKQGAAHVRLTALGRGTAEDLRGVVADLVERGLRGLLLDLRWCPGGFLNEAVEVADLFVGQGVIATARSRGREDTVYRSTDLGKFRGFPLVVLVNGETSGGAELIAAALQDHKRAAVAGQRTLGKGSIQTPVHVGVAGVGLRLTSGTFLRPSGKNLHRFPDSKSEDDWGVRPDADCDCRVSAELGRRLRDWWLWQSLRPADSSERLPLDDPDADPQRKAALEVLRERLGRARGR
jgi:carboxyl-terminal processing protease